MVVPHSASKERREFYQFRFRRRRGIAQYGRFPEGYEFRLALPDGTNNTIILLTPPDLVAVRYPGGIWTRERRVEEQHGPAPYSAAWYQEYLRVNHLPPYFMTLEHLNSQNEAAEAKHLRMGEGKNRINLDPPRELPVENWLELRYPARPMPLSLQEGRPYNLDRLEANSLARNWPMIIANSITFGDTKVTAHSQRYFFVNLPHDDPVDNSKAVRWPNAKDGVPASYVVRGDMTPAETARRTPNIRAREFRADELQARCDDVEDKQHRSENLLREANHTEAALRREMAQLWAC